MAKVRMTKEQREWCKRYEKVTTFEPLIDDFLAGNETFLQAARTSVRWFEDWSSDAHLYISRDIPGADAELEQSVIRSPTYGRKINEGPSKDRPGNRRGWALELLRRKRHGQRRHD